MANVQEFTTAQLLQYIPGQNIYTWKDALFSATAHSNNLDSTQYSPEQTSYDSIIVTFEKIVTPLNGQYPGQVHVNSCYRSHATEILVSGKDYGQHRKGQAVDLSSTGNATNRDFFNWVYNNVEFDQLIWENGSAPVTGSPGPITSGNPRWIHVSYNNDPGATQRKMVLQTQDGKTYRSIPGMDKPNNSITPQTNDGDNKDTVVSKKTNTSSDVNGNQSLDTNDPDIGGPNFQKTFEQIARNVAKLKAGDTAVTWGKRLNPSEDSDWIGLKQFLLYLASRYTPQSLLPFIELIPCVTMDKPIDSETTNNEISSSGYAKDGDTPKDIEQNLTAKSSDTAEKGKLKNKLREQLKFLSEVPPGYNKDRFETGAKATNNANLNADLFTLDPFKEGINYLGEESDSGRVVREQRNVGVRVYGQLVLNPQAIDGVSSKPGAIGFKSLEVQAGSSADNGLAIIKMQLVDVQGNKFTDLNSPWSFIYDTRPGSIGGDFYFRYGWQIRVPSPQIDSRDGADPSAYKFWYHPGWEIFGDEVRKSIMSQIVPGKQVITLTQAINSSRVAEEDNTMPLSLFDEGISFNSVDGTVTTTRAILASPDNNYVKLALLNPEIDMDEAGAITATLSFRTTGAVIYQLPLDYALTVRKKLVNRNKILLGDLLLALQYDADNFGFLSIKSKEDRLKQNSFATKDLAEKVKSRNFDGYVLLQGPDASGNQGDIHPDSILLDIDSKHIDMLTHSQRKTGVTVLRWFREVLQNNDCELLSPATGSGAGINSAWIITTTRPADKREVVKKVETKPKPEGKVFNNSEKLIETIKTEKDVFAYRFQGSLVTSMKVEKTQTPNAMSIQTDFTVGDLASDETSVEEIVNTPVTANDKKRNLKVIFSQMQNCTIECLCHPWIGPGKRIFVKGMGFFDGEYQVLEITHKLDGHKFTSSIVGARILLKNDEDLDKKDSQSFAAQSGNTNLSKPVNKQTDSVKSGEVLPVPPQGTKTTNTTLESTKEIVKREITPLTQLPPTNTQQNLLKLGGDIPNLYLGLLINPSFLNLVKLSPDGLLITKACLCEMRLGKGIDTSWFGKGDEVKSALDYCKSYTANYLTSVTESQLIIDGKGVNEKYTTVAIVNGTSTIIKIGS